MPKWQREKRIMIPLMKYRCLRCGYEWMPRKAHIPAKCANQHCRSECWQTTARSQKKRKAKKRAA